MTLPYALLTPLIDDERRGALSGFYSLSRGVGVALRPVPAGVAVSVGREPFPGSEGYQATFGSARPPSS